MGLIATGACVFCSMVLCAVARLATAQTVEAMDGPIPIRDARPFNLLYLQFLPETPDILPARGRIARAQLDIIDNLYGVIPQRESIVQEQSEYQRITGAWRWGIGGRTELALVVPILWRDAGLVSGVLNAYHHLLGVPTPPMGPYHTTELVISPDGTPLVNQHNAFGLGETTATAKYALIRATGRSALAARLGIKLPTGNPALLLGSGSVDAGVCLDGRYTLGTHFRLYGDLAGIGMGPSTRLQYAEDAMFQGLVCLEYRANRRDRWYWQIDGNSVAVRTLNGTVDGPQVMATFGYRRILGQRATLYTSASFNGHISNFELPYLSNIGPHFVFTAGVEWCR